MTRQKQHGAFKVPGSSPRSRMARVPLRRGVKLAGDMRQTIDP